MAKEIERIRRENKENVEKVRNQADLIQIPKRIKRKSSAITDIKKSKPHHGE